VGLSRKQLIIALVLAHLLGFGVLFVLVEKGNVPLDSILESGSVSSQVGVRNLATTSDSQLVEEEQISVEKKIPESTPVLIRQGFPDEVDHEDALLLYSGSNPTLFDENYCRIVEFYGLLCERFDLDQTLITVEELKDYSGEYFKLIGIQAENLLLSRSLFSQHELGELRNAVEFGGAHMLISELNAENFPSALIGLTDGAVVGVVAPEDSTKDWIISSERPAITRELTGQVFKGNPGSNPRDYAIVSGNTESMIPIMSSMDDFGNLYSFLAVVELGKGRVFTDASHRSPSLASNTLRKLFYSSQWYSRIIPLMVTVRNAFGDEAWHNDRNFANLMIDRMWLGDEIPEMDYLALLREMQTHNFHTTIGFIPARWDRSDTLAVAIFQSNPHLFSISQYGNNADGYEFYRYEVPTRDWFAGIPEPARPFGDQVADIIEGLERLERLWANYGIPGEKVMIFPGMPPEATIGILKQFNYLATINASTVPLGSFHHEQWDYGMYQANLEHENFPMISRKYLKDLESVQENLEYLIMDLFVDKPALMYSSAGRLFNGEMDAFSSFADRLNNIEGNLEWYSLGTIVKHLFLEKENDNGSIDIKMYTNHLILENKSNQDRDYHIKKEETLNFSISSVMINGHDTPFIVRDGFLQIDLFLPTRVSVEIIIQYQTAQDGYYIPSQAN